LSMDYDVHPLPYADEASLESRAVLKRLASAHRYLAELKGIAKTIPNENILISTLTLQEAKDSSAVENIVTTHDELYKADIFTDIESNAAAKEVRDYSQALQAAFAQVRQQRLIRLQDVLEVQCHLEKNRAGLRKLPGTDLKNTATGEVVYTPPQDAGKVQALVENLLQYINDAEMSPVDPILKMAIAHFQFESIHPFYDGNGRTGRIINILYLVANDLLDIPVLYLSRFIIQNKSEYYARLQAVRDHGDWENWLLFMLAGVEETAKQTSRLIENIRDLMMEFKHEIREGLPKLYSQDLINNLFRYPYTRIEFVRDDLGVSRLTAAKYLDQLTDKGFLLKRKQGRNNYYINVRLVDVLLLT
jgi:Fic family protein